MRKLSIPTYKNWIYKNRIQDELFKDFVFNYLLERGIEKREINDFLSSNIFLNVMKLENNLKITTLTLISIFNDWVDSNE